MNLTMLISQIETRVRSRQPKLSSDIGYIIYFRYPVGFNLNEIITQINNRIGNIPGFHFELSPIAGKEFKFIRINRYDPTVATVQRYLLLAISTPEAKIEVCRLLPGDALLLTPDDNIPHQHLGPSILIPDIIFNPLVIYNKRNLQITIIDTIRGSTREIALNYRNDAERITLRFGNKRVFVDITRSFN